MFNIFADTVWSKTHYDPSTIVMLLRGFAKGMPTKWLIDEMDLAYPSVLERRHRIQEAAGRGERGEGSLQEQRLMSRNCAREKRVRSV